MRSTGIIRRVDDLGRVVIPKEIRRTLRIHEGDPLEIFLDHDEITFKKYSFLGSLETYAKDFVQVMSQIFLMNAAEDGVVYVPKFIVEKCIYGQKEK